MADPATDPADGGPPPPRWLARLYRRARHPAYGALTAVALAGLGLLGSVYGQKLSEASVLDAVFRPISSTVFLGLLVVGFTAVSFLLFVGIGARRAASRRQVRQFERLLGELHTSIATLSERTADLGRQAEALTADQEKIRQAVLLLPDVNMADPFGALIRASEDAVDIAYTDGFDPGRAEKAVRRVLTDLADVVYAHLRTGGVQYRAPLRVGVNVQFHLDAATVQGLSSGAYNALSDRLRFRNEGAILHDFAGVLDVREELSACRQNDARQAPDPHLRRFALPVQTATAGDPTDVLQRHDEREIPHLPGAPLALATRAAHRYPDASALLSWIRHHPAYDVRARDDLQSYLEEERERVLSFAAVPLRSREGGPGPPLAVLSIHANRTGDFGSQENLAEFVRTARGLLAALRRPIADLHTHAYP